MSVGILGKKREAEVGKLGWHGNFDTGFERNISFVTSLKIQKHVCGFFERFWNNDCLIRKFHFADQ